MIPLPIEKAVWEQRVFPEKNSQLTETQAATFAIEQDPEMGPCLVVGPWRAGQWSARFDSTRPLPYTNGTVRGFYRTTGLLPYQAEVNAVFFQAAKKLKGRPLVLAPAPKWTPFELPVRIAPPGADSLRITVGLSDHTEGQVRFAKLSFSSDAPALDFGTATPKLTRPAPPSTLETNRYCRLVQRNGAWWLVRPDGQPFYSIATDAPGLPQGAAREQKAREMLATLQRAGFNSFGGWSSVPNWAPLLDSLAATGQVLPLFRSLQAVHLKAPFDCLAAPGETTDPAEHGFPDPFDPRYEAALRAEVRRTVQLTRNKPWFGGWFADNEMAFKDLHRRVYSPHCAAALQAFLETKYHHDIRQLNAAWGAAFASFAELIQRQPDPVLRQGAMYEDYRRFRREIVRRHIELTLQVLHDEDPGRLVFSQRFMMKHFSDWADLLDLFQAYNGIGVNMYPDNVVPGLSANERAALELIHQRTGKPILITEWSIPAIDSRLYDSPAKLDWSWDCTVATQTERARQAARVALDQYNLPFVVGAHWFTWKDFDSEKRQANRGLVRTNGQPWPELLQALGEVHTRLGK